MKAVSEDGSPFLYPLTGMQQLCNAFKEYLEDHTEYCDILLQLYVLILIDININTTISYYLHILNFLSILLVNRIID